ncbi:MAG: hypothetical protein KJ941_03905 [Bacteroidetes bacterium]|nr:hypothetical protein [Bacteroidota bacterium]
MKPKDWNKRPKGCRRTVSGMHIPRERNLDYYTIEFYCSACGLIDDTGEFGEHLFGEPEKVDDTKPI